MGGGERSPSVLLIAKVIRQVAIEIYGENGPLWDFCLPCPGGEERGCEGVRGGGGKGEGCGERDCGGLAENAGNVRDVCSHYCRGNRARKRARYNN